MFLCFRATGHLLKLSDYLATIITVPTTITDLVVETSLNMEHLNRVCKDAVAHLGAIVRIGKTV